MLKDRKSTKIILLILAIILMLIPGFRIFHLRGGMMRDGNLDMVDVHYDSIGMLHAESTSGDIRITYDSAFDGISVKAGRGSSSIGGNSNLTVSTKAEDIEIKFGPDSVDEIRAASTSGSIWADGATLDTLDLSSISGSIHMAAGDVESALSLSTTSGSIDVEGTSTEKLFASVKSGSLKITSSDTEDMTLTSISGGIDVRGTEAEDVRITTTSGNTTFAALEDCFIDYSITSGKVKTAERTLGGTGAYGNEAAPLHIDFNSVSGNLTII